MNVLLGFGQVQEGRVSGRGVLKNNPAYGVLPPLVGKYHGAQMLKNTPSASLEFTTEKPKTVNSKESRHENTTLNQ